MVHIETDDKNNITVEIRVKRANILLRVLLLFIAVFPFAAIFYAIASQDVESPFAVLLGLLFFGLLSFIMIRILLWNTYGREVYLIEGNEITSYNDYGLVKDNRQVRLFAELQVKCATREQPEELLSPETLEASAANESYLITFLADGEAIASVIPVPFNDIQKLAEIVSKLNRSFPDIVINLN